jgi:glutaredoxin
MNVMAITATVRPLLRCLAWAGLLLAAGAGTPAFSRTIVTCEDANGERFFSARCPTGTRQIESREVSTGTPAPAAPADDAPPETAPKPPADGVRQLREVVVYVAPDCVPCEFIERHLQNRRVAFRRVDVEADPASFEAVKGRLETVGVPVLTVGDELLTGFQPKRIDQTLVTLGVLLATDVPNYEAPEAAPPLPPPAPAGAEKPSTEGEASPRSPAAGARPAAEAPPARASGGGNKAD